MHFCGGSWVGWVILIGGVIYINSYFIIRFLHNFEGILEVIKYVILKYNKDMKQFKVNVSKVSLDGNII